MLYYFPNLQIHYDFYYYLSVSVDISYYYSLIILIYFNYIIYYDFAVVVMSIFGINFLDFKRDAGSTDVVFIILDKPTNYYSDTYSESSLYNAPLYFILRPNCC